MGVPEVANQRLTDFIQENNCRLKGDIETLADGTRVALAEVITEKVEDADANYDQNLAALFLNMTEKHDQGTMNTTRNALRIFFQTPDGQNHLFGRKNAKNMPESQVQMVLDNANSGEMMKKLSKQVEEKGEVKE